MWYLIDVDTDWFNMLDPSTLMLCCKTTYLLKNESEVLAREEALRLGNEFCKVQNSKEDNTVLRVIKDVSKIKPLGENLTSGMIIDSVCTMMSEEKIEENTNA